MSVPHSENKTTPEMKQSFLASAITDISTYIQLSDTKVSIIMGALVALIAGALACYDPISKAIAKITPCSWSGVVTVILFVLFALSVGGIFVFGILTIRGHVSRINYQSRWFLPKDTKEYSFDAYKKDVLKMTDDDVIENMAAELYKLNDINRQKAATCKWTIRLFASTLIVTFFIAVVLLISVK